VNVSKCGFSSKMERFFMTNYHSTDRVGPVSQVHIHPPQWDERGSYNQCYKCAEKMKKTAHNCRACGHLYCSNCTTKMDDVPDAFRKKHKSGAVRVCDMCRFFVNSNATYDESDKPQPEVKTNTSTNTNTAISERSVAESVSRLTLSPTRGHRRQASDVPPPPPRMSLVVSPQPEEKVVVRWQGLSMKLCEISHFTMNTSLVQINQEMLKARPDMRTKRYSFMFRGRPVFVEFWDVFTVGTMGLDIYIQDKERIKGVAVDSKVASITITPSVSSTAAAAATTTDVTESMNASSANVTSTDSGVPETATLSAPVIAPRARGNTGHRVTITVELPPRPMAMSVSRTSEKELHVRSLYEYNGPDDTHMNLHPNDMIAVINQEDEAWWYGHNQRSDISGWFPASYVEAVMDDDTDSEPDHDDDHDDDDDGASSTFEPAAFVASNAAAATVLDHARTTTAAASTDAAAASDTNDLTALLRARSKQFSAK
jgi:SH3 domain/FYVE zinc finger